MRNYELVLILDAQLGDNSFEGVITRYEEQLTSSGGQMVNIDRWGLRKLAYPITKRRRNQGYYVLYQFTGEPAQLGPLEERLKVDEDVLRHMVIAVQGEFVRVPQLAPEGEILGAARTPRPPDAGRPAPPRQATPPEGEKAAADAGEAAAAEGGADTETDGAEKTEDVAEKPAETTETAG